MSGHRGASSMATDASGRRRLECERTGGQLGWASVAATTNQRDAQHESATTWRNVMHIGFPTIGLALVFVLLYFVVNSRRDTSPTRR
jgi:hypothetical protein